MSDRTKSVVDIMIFRIQFLINWRQDSLFVALINILIILFWILKILVLYIEVPQKIMPIIYSNPYIVNAFFKYGGTRICNYYTCVISK